MYTGGYGGREAYWLCTPLYMHLCTPPGIYTTLYTLGIPPCACCHDCTGVRCMRCAAVGREEALGSNLGLITGREAPESLQPPKV